MQDMTQRHIRTRLAAILTALLLPLGFTLMATAGPASAGVFYDQCAPPGGGNGGTCLNFWNGGYLLATYQGVAYNNYIYIQDIGNNQFQLVDGVGGGCIGDNGNSPTDARAEGGLLCPSASPAHAGWGTRFEIGGYCGNGYVRYYNVHWQSWLGFADGNDHQVYLNTGGRCLQQQS
jgi:hypothetical protein